MLVEQQAFGPLGYVPVEWMAPVYDAIVSATAAGIIVVEPAANGAANLDDPLYGTPFPMGKPDSGAIMVGAGAAPCSASFQPTRSRLEFSGFGQRVDVQGWGECVSTTEYGDLFGTEPAATDWYTQSFNGTSSASAMVAGVAAGFSSAFERATGTAATPARTRKVLIDTGTRQAGSRQSIRAQGAIGPLPNLRAALTQRYLRLR